MYLAVAEKQGADWTKSRGTLQNDILKEYIAQKEYIYPPEPSMRLVIDTIEFGAQAHSEVQSDLDQRLPHPRGRLDGDSGTGVHPARRHRVCGAVHPPRAWTWTISRRGFLFSSTRTTISSRRSPNIAPRAASGTDDDASASARRIPRSWALRFHAQTAGCSLTAQQPYNNVVRTALQALAAVMGGTQSLHTNSLDEAWALPTESAATLALRTQQIIAHESGVTNTADPFGGSYFVETLTNEVERGARDYIEKIDAMGGMVAAIERGLPAARNRRRGLPLPDGRRPQGKNHRRRQ